MDKLQRDIYLTEEKLRLYHRLRDDRIKAAVKAGNEPATVARFWGVSRQRVYQIVNGRKR